METPGKNQSRVSDDLCTVCNHIQREKTVEDLKGLPRRELVELAIAVAKDTADILKETRVLETANEENVNALVPYMSDSELISELGHMYERHALAKGLTMATRGALEYTDALIEQVGRGQRITVDYQASEEFGLMRKIGG